MHRHKQPPTPKPCLFTLQILQACIHIAAFSLRCLVLTTQGQSEGKKKKSSYAPFASTNSGKLKAWSSYKQTNPPCMHLWGDVLSPQSPSNSVCAIAHCPTFQQSGIKVWLLQSNLSSFPPSGLAKLQSSVSKEMQSSGVVLTLTYCLNIRLTCSLHWSQGLRQLPGNKEDAKRFHYKWMEAFITTLLSFWTESTSRFAW